VAVEAALTVKVDMLMELQLEVMDTVHMADTVDMVDKEGISMEKDVVMVKISQNYHFGRG
jgi:hypothetical protein